MSDLNAMVAGRPASFYRLLYFYQFREFRPREALGRAAVPALQGATACASFSETLLKSAKLFAIGKKIPQTGANQGGLHPGALAPPIWRRPTRLAEPEEDGEVKERT
jgi:hypothetical protein